MPKTLTEVSRDAAQLSQRERLKLARILLDLSDPDVNPSEAVQVDWDKEIARRLGEIRSGAVTGVPLENVKERMEKRFGS